MMIPFSCKTPEGVVTMTGMCKAEEVAIQVCPVGSSPYPESVLTPPPETYTPVVPDKGTLTVVTGAKSNQLSWPASAGRVAVYGSTTDNREVATKLGETSDNVFTHVITNNLIWYYWIRSVDDFGEEFGDFAPNTTTGVAASGDGKLDLANDVTGALAAGNITGLGALALINKINLGTQADGSLSYANVTGLGALATQDTVNGSTQVTNLGNLAYANSIAANEIGAGTLAAGVIYSGTINANQINAGTITSVTLLSSVLYGKADLTTTDGSAGCIGKASGSGPGLAGRHTSPGAEGHIGTNGGYAFKAVSGTAGPFTGSHDALLPASHPFVENGEILVDVAVLGKRGVNDTITEVARSTVANQKGVIGVQSRRCGFIEEDDPPPALTDSNGALTAEARALIDSHRLLLVNSVGEGQIYVCGEGGDLEVGDLIVTSNLPGKGMKQADDIVRSYTVAKSREAVTFSSPDEVKLVACIYLCG